MVKLIKKMPKQFIAACITAVFFVAGTAVGVNKEDITHLSRSKNKRGCAACHDAGGKGKTGMMLRDRPAELCLRCHGPSAGHEERAINIFSQITRKSNHPVIETARFHSSDEELPEKRSTMPRHVSCLDCHNAHMTRPDNPMAGAKGVSLSGFKKAKAEKEAEVCYGCHSDSENRPYRSEDLRREFAPSNRSYHPVEKISKRRSYSLIARIKQGSSMTCTDCHEPHGSEYPPLLRANYAVIDGAESTYAYELCYACHDRNSILSNQSFKGSMGKDYGHKEHIVYQKTSCHTCHSSHGSTMNANLIKFDPSVVTGLQQYLDYKGGRAQCNLVCHGKQHK